MCNMLLNFPLTKTDHSFSVFLTLNYDFCKMPPKILSCTKTTNYEDALKMTKIQKSIDNKSS